MESLFEIASFVVVMAIWFALLIGNRLFAAATWRLAIVEIKNSIVELRNFSLGRFFRFLENVALFLFLIGIVAAPFMFVFFAVDKYA